MPSEFGCGLLEIVDDDEIEVGTCGHFAGAEPAECDDRAFAAADAAVDGGEIGFHSSVNGAQQHVGKPREGLTRLLRRHRPGENSRADQEHMLLAEQADGVERRLVAGRVFQHAAELRFEPRLVGQRAEEARIDQRIDEVRMVRQDVGQPRRRAEDERDEADQVRILPQQRQKAAARAQSGEEPIERDKSRVRILRARKLIDDDRYELGEIGARLLAAQRAVAPGLPIAHRGGEILRPAKAHQREPVERFAFAFAGGKRQVLLPGQEFRGALE